MTVTDQEVKRAHIVPKAYLNSFAVDDRAGVRMASGSMHWMLAKFRRDLLMTCDDDAPHERSAVERTAPTEERAFNS